MAKTDPLDFPGFPAFPLGGWSAQIETQHLGKDDDDEDDDDIEVDDDDSDDDEDDEDDDDDDEDDEDGDDVEKLRAALKAERAAHRTTKKKAKAKTPEPKPKPKAKKTKDDEDDDEDDSVDRRIREVEERSNSRIKRAEARSALKDAGLADGISVEKALRMLDLDDVEVDEDGEVVGLEDALADLKDDSPALFAKKTGSRGRRRDASARDTVEDRKPKSATEKQAEALRRGSRRR